MREESRIGRLRLRTTVALAAAVGLAGITGACSKKEEAPPTPRSAEQQRAVDSTIGASRLPGAGGVRNALAVSDSAAKRKAELDSIARNP